MARALTNGKEKQLIVHSQFNNKEILCTRFNSTSTAATCFLLALEEIPNGVKLILDVLAEVLYLTHHAIIGSHHLLLNTIWWKGTES
mmetsp:Transcript_10336/g.17538  ORF Transcript_10336/g.17538 Transcript_10336/m.17538 type:complete len:87 (-) Transcript_10336:702-962(-)